VSLWRRVWEGIFIVLAGYLSLIGAGIIAGLVVGAITAAVSYSILVLTITSCLTDTTANVPLAAAILLGLFAFWRTLTWFATFGGLLRRR